MGEMKEKKESKFKVGDTVVIIMYGTVGKITKVKWMDGMYVYQINNSDGLYMESSLQLISEYKNDLFEEEKIDIECRFFIGDIVQVDGYDGDLFKVIGFRTEIWRYEEEAWEEVIYELSRISDGKGIEAKDDELFLIADKNQADLILQKLDLFFEKKKKKKKYIFRKEELERIEEKRLRKEMIDRLLDTYNDYRTLYEMFGDDEYKQMMEIIIRKLTIVSNEKSILG